MNRCFPCLRRSVFRQSLVHFLYFSPLRLASSLLFSSTRFLFSGYRKINASATAVSPMIGTIQEILKIPSVTTGSNAVACEYPIKMCIRDRCLRRLLAFVHRFLKCGHCFFIISVFQIPCSVFECIGTSCQKTGRYCQCKQCCSFHVVHPLFRIFQHPE